MIKKLQKKLKEKKIKIDIDKEYSLSTVLGSIANILVIPIFTIQIINIIKRGKASDYSLYFILLQLIGTPEGGGALITGLIKSQYTIAIIGGYGFIYYLIVLFYYLFPRTKSLVR
jgi:hypothetical protein